MVNFLKPGAGFITLAATLSVVPTIPLQGLALLIGIDRFISEARGLTNMVGNGFATIAIAHWEKDLDHERLQAALKWTNLMKCKDLPVLEQ